MAKLSQNTVRGYIARGSKIAGPSTPDAELAVVLYNQDLPTAGCSRYQGLEACFKSIDKELTQPGVTQQLLWREYLDEHPDCYSYS